MSQRHQGIHGEIELVVPTEFENPSLIDAIDQLFPIIRESDRTLSRRFYDCFDWRLFTAGISLEWRFDEVSTSPYPGLNPLQSSHPVSPILCWCNLIEPNAEPVNQPLESEPGLLDEIPTGPVRDRLAKLLEMRRLLPMVDVISQQSPLRLLNEDEKTVVRLVIEQNRFREPHSGRHGILSCRLRLQPIRGYPEAFEHAKKCFEERLGFCPLNQSLAHEALLAAGHRPGAYSTKLDEQLDPSQRADLATKQILRGLLETLEANIEGTRQNLDSEFLHDLRVATRRTRSALSQIKGVFPETVVTDFKQRFAWLQQVTGPVRDLDVYLLDFPEMERRLPPDLRSDLKPLHEQLLCQHSEAQRLLASELGSLAFSNLLQDWRAFLDAPVPDVEAGTAPFDEQPDSLVAENGDDRRLGESLLVNGDQQSQRKALPRQGALPIQQVADQRIRKMLKRVRAEGRAITEDSPPEALHELRKSCKKLRYLMEFFQSLYPKDRIREQIKQTKLLLDNLGRFQDTAVQAEHLREHAESSASDNGLPPGTLLAMGALIGQLLNDQARARAGFGEVFATFDSAENADRFKLLLAAGGRQQAARVRNAASGTGGGASDSKSQFGLASDTKPEPKPGPGLTRNPNAVLSPRR